MTSWPASQLRKALEIDWSCLAARLWLVTTQTLSLVSTRVNTTCNE